MDDEQKVGEPSENALDDLWQRLGTISSAMLGEILQKELDGLQSAPGPVIVTRWRRGGAGMLDGTCEPAEPAPDDKLAERRAKRRRPDSYPFPDHR